MASTTSAPPPGMERDLGPTGEGGGGFQHGRPAPVSTFPAAVRPSQTGIWVALAAISMMFAALTSAMVIRQGAARDWGHFELPGILYFNTLILLLSSFSLEMARLPFAQDPDLGREESRGNGRRPAQVLYWLYATMGLGLIFVFGQLAAWRELAAQGLFLATTPSSSFFYVLTAVHGVHLLGGITGLAYVLHRMSRSTGSRPRTALGVASVYWHFMDGLWVYLILLMMTRMNVA
ncbi:MAG: cytochrome oxidase subunit III [Verrucomicrobia bacterium]|nr:MAG: cytochrome oxidase subunit III [Verrucomicrobiota bacterium]PYT66407.1 MAG: cytochrome oxidase subunit III [Acidobacteriota bacterium]